MDKLLLLIVGSLFAVILTSCGYESDQVSRKDSESYTGDPGFEEDLKIMKIEQGIKVPSDYRSFWRGEQIQSRSANSPVESVVELGPFRVGGRTRAIVVDRTNRNHILAGSISGGIWESYDGGLTWNPKEIAEDNLSITHMDQSTLNPNLIFYTTGEVTGNSAGIDGVGVFRSLDKGQTFELLPATQTNDFFRSWRVACSHVDTNTIYVATRSGLFRSNNLGEDFETVFSGHVSDVELTDEDEVYIGVDEDGVYYSSNGEANSFQRLTIDSFPNELGRVEIALCPSDDRTLYVSYEGAIESFDGIGGVFKSLDAGDNWELLPEIPFRTDFAWYTNTLKVSAQDCDLVFAGSVEAGYYLPLQGWRQWETGYADQHVFVEGVDSISSMLVGNDGGIYELEVNPQTGIPIANTLKDRNDGYAVTQFYTGAVSAEAKDFMGGTQDNGTWQFFNPQDSFFKVFGGDGAFCYLDPSASTSIVSFQRGNFYFLEYENGFVVNWYEILFDLSDYGTPYFINPLYSSSVDSETLFVPTTESIVISQDFGGSTSSLVEEVTQPYVVKDRFKSQKQLVFYAGGRGLLRRIDDVAAHDSSERGVDLTANMPSQLRSGFIRDIEFDPVHDSILYVGFSTRSDASRVWKVTDIYSDQPMWESIGDGLPRFLPVNDLQFITAKPYTLVAGTDYGLYTYSEGEWLREDQIPPVVIYQVKERDTSEIYAFTHGRGIFKLDMKVDPRTSVKNESRPDFSLYPNPVAAGQNFFWNTDQSVTEVQLYDMKGRLVKRLMGSGLNVGTAPVPKGIYLVVLKQESGILARQQIVVQ
jgi:hypothetical protein